MNFAVLSADVARRLLLYFYKLYRQVARNIVANILPHEIHIFTRRFTISAKFSRDIIRDVTQSNIHLFTRSCSRIYLTYEFRKQVLWILIIFFLIQKLCPFSFFLCFSLLQLFCLLLLMSSFALSLPSRRKKR